MKRMYWSRGKLLRLFFIASALCIYVGLEITNALEIFHGPSTFSSVLWLAFIFGLFSLVSFVFLAVGSLVWLYAREHRVASLLFAYSVVMMSVFIASANFDMDPLFFDIGTIGAILALTLNIIILFYFPQNLLSVSNPHLTRHRIFFSAYLVFSSIFIVLCFLIQLNIFGMGHLGGVVLLYYVLGFCTIATIAVRSSIKLEVGREKQQMRIFFGGLVASVMPLFILTILPLFLNLEEYSVNGRYTSLACVIFPLALGYAVLRYQLLVLDTYVRRVVSFIVGATALAILAYLEVVCINIFLPGNISSLAVIIIVISPVIFIPLIWKLSRRVTDRLLFPEIIHYNRVLQEPSLVSEEILRVDDIARWVTTAAIQAFEVPQVCFLVLNETSTCYQLSPGFSDSALDSPRIGLITKLQHMVASESHDDEYCLDVRLPALQRLLNSRRPVLLSEILFSKEERPRGLARVMNAKSLLEQDDYLLAPLRAQGQMIGILVLGERADHQPYAGPDFEIVQILTGRFALLLDNARLYARASKQDERQRELDALKEQFLTVASHELRTPLTAVQGYIELLCEHDDMLLPETRAEFLEQARIGCDDLNLMMNNILDAHLVHGDVARIYLHPIPLSVTVLNVLELLSASIQRESHSVSADIDRDLVVLADDLRLRQILVNLISNALKYSASGTRIEISAVKKNIDVHISVRDYGFGVPLDWHRPIFERFTRLERDMNSPIRGAGLGLHICKSFVTAMGGRIWVESSGIPGEGSVFTFVLRCVAKDQV